MHYQLVFLLLMLFISFCQKETVTSVSNHAELNQALLEVRPGDEIVMANGEWNDVQIRFSGLGTEDRPITLRAETPGKVIIQGRSDLKLGGEYLVVDGLFFTNGYSPGQSVLSFGINDDTLAYHSRVTNCVISNFNKSQRDNTDVWVLFKGRHNQLDHCYIAGKSNRGPTVRVDLEGNPSIRNYHQITNNHFGPRPPKGGPSAETIQIGNSSTSMAPSYTQVAGNLFDRCNGEVEVISSKANFNEFRNNVFFKSEGSLVTRHGNYCVVDGNYFIGDEQSEQIGGVRLIGTGHWVTNNYFYQLQGKVFRSPLAIMNGIPRSPLNRYLQVTDVVIANNSWINCTAPWQIGVGANLDEKGVLPPSEIRSARPIRTIMANNLLYNDPGDPQSIVAHDRIDGIDFKSNVINNQGVEFEPQEGLVPKSFGITQLEEYIWIPNRDFPDVEVYQGFGFDQISRDLFGNSRKGRSSIGAVSASPASPLNIMDRSKYGPNWYSTQSTPGEPQTHTVEAAGDLAEIISRARDGDLIELPPGQFEISAPLKIDKSLTLRSADANERTTLLYQGKEMTPAFEMNPGGKLTLQGLNLQGTKAQYAFAPLTANMSSLYNLSVSDCILSDFDFILKAYKHSFAEHVIFQSTVLRNCNNGLDLSAETEDRGDYNAENLIIDQCHFEDIDRNVINYYRGGYDESTVGGNLRVTNSTFTGCGAKEEDGILLNTYGIINVDLSGNKFLGNPVQMVALLWGAKNNSHSENLISNSGRIVVEENLKLKLVY